RLDRNIAAMQALADETGVALRPHAKTHKSVAIMRRQLQAGAAGITVAKLDEAEALIDGGATSILVANQIVDAAKLDRAIWLAGRAELILGVDSGAGLHAIGDAARR